MASPAESGFIALHRRLKDHWIWSRADWLAAWIDLLLSANWRDGKQLVNGQLVDVPRGSIVASERYLEERWAHFGVDTRNRVRRLLALLEDDGMISRTTIHPRATVVNVCNFDVYQTGQPQNNPRDTREVPASYPRATRELPKDEEGNKGNKGTREQQRALKLEGDNEEETAKETADDLPALPASLDTEQVRSALTAYDRHRRQKRQKMTDEAWKRLLTKLKDWGPERTVEALDHSIANGWTGVFEPGNGNGGPPAPGAGKGSTHHLGGAEWLDQRIAEIESEELDQ